ncbi:Golgi membrane protein 1-like isoform X2 [Pristis pectinata]|uniref:Golgi membrane protein 1-like isoform X2 n=1 Tax=Pristis pectinata TaxID=685728 RepID=UPI00223C9F23|nr:Golgi membrane protein 1-like isoform X2 [Pristis pectinata]
MVGLGSGRRSARSTPLLFLLLALGACLAFLALSYWVSSSRGAELRERVAVLDAKVRRAAADVSAAELRRHQLQVQLQNQLEGHQEEIGQLVRLHRQQLQSKARVCSEEKEDLNKNITSSTKVIHTLQEQFQQLQMGYSQLNQKLQELQKKLAYDITQCSNQINDQKELYEEQIKELNRRLADATKSQAGNRNTEATDQTKLLKEHKSAEKKEITEPSNEESQSPKENDHTSQLEVKTNKIANSTKSTLEPESNKVLNTGALENMNGTIVNNEIQMNTNPGVDENNQDHLDTVKQGNTDYSRDAGDAVAKESALQNDIEV